MKAGKITSLILCAAITANMLVSSVSASAYSGTGESRIYTYNGYTVEYKIVNEWTGNQNIEITVTNTSDEILADWAVGYNASGEINGLWNAQVYAVQGTEYILKGADYNSEIAPGQSVRFGYILSGEEFKYPQNIFNCAKRVDISDNYDVYYNVTGDYGDTYQAEMVIENLSDTDYSAWQLSFDGNAAIDNLWNAKLLENNNSSFKVKNAEHNSVIYAGNSVSFNFSGTKLFEDNVDMEETAEVITAEVTEEAQPDTTSEAESSEFETAEPADVPTAESAEEVQPEVTDEAEITAPETSETVDTQTGEGIDETQTDEVSSKTEETADETADTTNETAEVQTEAETYGFEYSPMNTSVEANSNVVFGNYKLTAVVIPVEFDFEFDPELDSDGDGLPDYIERGLGLDRNNPDTDGDGLPDGYEYYYLGTDPAKADSDDNGVSDADEDFDEDGLTNIEEYELSTNPFVADTDRDGLSDYDEVYNYNTDPTNPDTDGDKVTDGDEIILGLDPNNPETNGYPDSEYTTTQTISKDSGALDYINNLEENPYTISVEVTAAGVADNCLSADESGYSSVILQNDAVLGVVSELTYSEGLSVTDVVINFHIDDSAVENELGIYDDPAFKGINRFSVFKYFEDNNVLLPIETFYDEENDTVYTHVDVMGTYCLIDMEKWLNNIENAPKGNYYEESDNEPANIVFCLDTRDIIDSESFDDIKANIKAITDDAFGRYDDIKVYVYYQRFGSNFKVTNNLLRDSETGENYFTCYEDAEAALDRLERYLIKSSFWAYDYVEATQFMIDTCDENIIAMYHITADERVMGSVSGAKKLLQTVQNSKYTTRDEEEINRIYVSLLCPNSDKVIDPDSYAAQLVEASGGIIYTAAEEIDTEVSQTTRSFSLQSMAAGKAGKNNLPNKKGAIGRTVITDLRQKLGDGDTCEYNVLVSTGLISIKLDKKLTKGAATDTDHDGLSDWDEVDWERINKVLEASEKATIEKNIVHSDDFPTLSDCMSYYKDIYYVANVAYGYNSWAISKVSDYPMLIISSNPVDADSDNDGIPDSLDLTKLNKNNAYNPINSIEDCFIIVHSFDNFGKNAVITSNTCLYAMPYLRSKTVEEIAYGISFGVLSLIYSDNHYWLKIKSNNIYGYIDVTGTNFDISPYIYSPIQDTTDIYAYNMSKIHVNKTNKETCEFYYSKALDTSTNLIFKPLRPNYDVSDVGNPNICGNGIYLFSYESQEYIQSVCDTVLAEYENECSLGNISEETLNFLKKHLNPMLIIAIGAVETGWDIATGNKTGIVDSTIIQNCIGGKNATPNLCDYQNFKDSVAASAVLISHNILEQIEGGYGNVYGNTRSENGLLNDGQVLFNALYNYGCGRTEEGCYSYTESAVGAAHKIYRYGMLSVQERGYVAIDTSIKAIESYANNEWLFEIVPNNIFEPVNVNVTD